MEWEERQFELMQLVVRKMDERKIRVKEDPVPPPITYY